MRKKPLRSLRKRREFELVFKDRRTFASKYLVMYARPNELSFNRLGLSVSKKIGNAVIRNRIKRLAREAMRKGLEGLPADYDFVIVARKPSIEIGLEDFIRIIKGFLAKLIDEKDSDITHKII
jgi:ribonuclease P protein component